MSIRHLSSTNTGDDQLIAAVATVSARCRRSRQYGYSKLLINRKEFIGQYSQYPVLFLSMPARTMIQDVAVLSRASATAIHADAYIVAPARVFHYDRVSAIGQIRGLCCDLPVILLSPWRSARLPVLSRCRSCAASSSRFRPRRHPKAPRPGLSSSNARQPRRRCRAVPRCGCRRFASPARRCFPKANWWPPPGSSRTAISTLANCVRWPPGSPITTRAKAISWRVPMFPNRAPTRRS